MTDATHPDLDTLRALAASRAVVRLGAKPDWWGVGSYAETGMTARVVGVEVDAEDPEGCSLLIDYSEFATQNLPFETTSFFDSNGRPTRTAREAGFYADRESLYVPYDHVAEVLAPVAGMTSRLLAAHVESEGRDGLGYVEWIERLAARQLGIEADAEDTPTLTAP